MPRLVPGAPYEFLRVRNFQFSIWDAYASDDPQEVIKRVAFNSLFEMRGQAWAVAQGCVLRFQFSIWDAKWRQ